MKDTFVFSIPIFNVVTSERTGTLVEAITAQDAHTSLEILFCRTNPDWFIDPARDWSLAVNPYDPDDYSPWKSEEF